MFKFSKFAVAAAALMTQTHASGAVDPAAGTTSNSTTNSTAAAAAAAAPPAGGAVDPAAGTTSNSTTNSTAGAPAGAAPAGGAAAPAGGAAPPAGGAAPPAGGAAAPAGGAAAGATPAKADPKEAHPMDKVLEIMLPKLPEAERQRYRAPMLSLAHEIAAAAALSIEDLEVNKKYVADDKKFDGVLNIGEMFHKADNDAKARALFTSSVIPSDDKTTLIQSIIAGHAKDEAARKAELDNFKDAMKTAYVNELKEAADVDKFVKEFEDIESRMVKAIKMIADSTRDCLSGHCDDEALKALAAGPKTLDDAIKNIKVADSIKEANKKDLDSKGQRVKIVEDFAKKVNAGTKTTKLQVQLKKKEAESKALALGLGLGLGLGLPAVFAVSMLVLFKSGRLAWVPSTSIDSQA